MHSLLRLLKSAKLLCLTKHGIKWLDHAFVCVFSIGAFHDDRLAVVATQIDTVYELGDSVPDEIRSVSCESISRATQSKVSMSSDAIILVSGKWALAARRMESCVPHQQPAMNKAAMKCLSKFPGCPCGQGVSKRDFLKSLNPTEVTKRLEEASGIDVLEKRLGCQST